eukprot:6604836-Alexandrium_andersonii.AAC.1
MEREVDECVGNFLQTQNLRDWQSAEKVPNERGRGSQQSSRKASDAVAANEAAVLPGVEGGSTMDSSGGAVDPAVVESAQADERSPS